MLLSVIGCLLLSISEIATILAFVWYPLLDTIGITDETEKNVSEIEFAETRTSRVVFVIETLKYLKIVVSAFFTLFNSISIVRMMLMVRKALSSSASMNSKGSGKQKMLLFFVSVSVINSLLFLISDFTEIGKYVENVYGKEENVIDCEERIGEASKNIDTSTFSIGYTLSCISYIFLFTKIGDRLCLTKQVGQLTNDA